MRVLPLKGLLMSEEPLGQQWGKEPPTSPSAKQVELSFDAKEKYLAARRHFYVMFAAMVSRAGGDFAVAKRMGVSDEEAHNIAKKIREAMHGASDRKLQYDWFVAANLDDDAGFLALESQSEFQHCEPPVKERRVIDPEAFAKASREVFAEMDPDHKEVHRKKLAKKLGIRVEDIKL